MIHEYLMKLDSMTSDPVYMAKEVSKKFGLNIGRAEIKVKKFLGVIDV